MSQKQKDLSENEKIDKFAALFPDPVALKRIKSGVEMLVRNKFGLKKGKTQSVEQFELECLLRYQFCEVNAIPLVWIGSTYVVNGKVGMEVDLMMHIVSTKAPEAEFELVQCNSTVCVLKGRRYPDKPWIACKWTIEKAEKIIQGFGTKALWKNDAEDMLNARCYGSLAKWICRKELGGGNAYMSKEEIDNLQLE